MDNEVIPFPEKRYSIIYADPPWNFKLWSRKGDNRSAECHYNVMNTSDIHKLPVSDISYHDSALFMWATYPKLLDATATMEAWGFEYKTVAFTWHKLTRHGKDHIGLGYWTRANPEICLLGTRGSPKRINKSVRNFQEHTIGRHSEKPAAIRDEIVKLMGDIPRIELFARERTDGWDAWGNEI